MKDFLIQLIRQCDYLYGVKRTSLYADTATYAQRFCYYGLFIFDGKTTTLNILSGITVPNFGKYDKPGDVDAVLEKFSNNIMGGIFPSPGLQHAFAITAWVSKNPLASGRKSENPRTPQPIFPLP